MLPCCVIMVKPLRTVLLLMETHLILLPLDSLIGSLAVGASSLPMKGQMCEYVCVCFVRLRVQNVYVCVLCVCALHLFVLKIAGTLQHARRNYHKLPLLSLVES